MQNNRPLQKLDVMNASLEEEEDKVKAHALYAHDIEWAKRECLKNVENIETKFKEYSYLKEGY